MAVRTPVVNAPSVTSQPSAPRTVRPVETGDANAHGAGIGAGVQQLSEGMLKIVDAADRERVLVEKRGLAEWKAINVDHPETGALAKKLTNARGISADVLKRFRSYGDSIKKNLGNGHQRRLFEADFEAQYDGLSNALSAHESRELAAAGKGGYDANLLLAKNDGARAIAYGNYEDLMDARKRLFATVDDYRPTAGWTDAEADGELLAHQTDFHAKVIETLVSPDQRRYDEARRYLDVARPEMDQKAVNDLDEKIRKVSKEATDAQLSVGVWRSAQLAATDTFGRFSEEKAREVFATNDPEVQARTKDWFDAEVRQAKNVQAQRDEQRIGRIYKMIRETGHLDREHPDYQHLDDKGQAAAQEMEKTYHRDQRIEDSAARQQAEWEDAVAVNEFLGLTPEERMKMTDDQIVKTYGRASEKGVAKIHKERERARHLVENGLEVGYGTFMLQVRNSAAAVKKDKDKLALIDAMNTWYMVQSAQPPIGKGKVPTEAEVATELGAWHLKLGIPMGTPGNRFGVDKPAGRVPESQRGQFSPLPADQQPSAAARALLGRGGGEVGEAGRRAAAGAPAPDSPQAAKAKSDMAKYPDRKLVWRDGKFKAVKAVQPGDVEF